jgi:hypothetical protein
MAGRLLVGLIVVAAISGCSSSGGSNAETTTATTVSDSAQDLAAVVVGEREQLLDKINQAKQGCRLGACSPAAAATVEALALQADNLRLKLEQRHPTSEVGSLVSATSAAAAQLKTAGDKIVELKGCLTTSRECESATVELATAVLAMESKLDAWSAYS